VNEPLNPSKYTVYVGVNDISFLSTGSSLPYPAVAMAVKNVIQVSSKINDLQYCLICKIF
jgi:hypothetical protein